MKAQKKKNRNGRDSYERLLVNGWHLEVSSAEINVDNDNIPIVLSVDIYGCDYHGSCFNQTIKPSTQSERKNGRWIIKDNPGTGWYRVTCSECGEDVTSTAPCIGFYPNAKVTWDYCPNCGADMRGELE